MARYYLVKRSPGSRPAVYLSREGKTPAPCGSVDEITEDQVLDDFCGEVRDMDHDNRELKIDRYTSLAKPCSECPFRRESAPGWLGPWTAEKLLASLSVQRFPCHRTMVDEDVFEPLEETFWRGCAGAAMYLNNRLELSRCAETADHQRVLAGSKLAESVFSSAAEFLEHHRRYPSLSVDERGETP